MLKGIDPILSPDLLRILRAMGHGDTIVIADANFPAASISSQVVRLDGISATRVLKAVLSVLPLDTFVQDPTQTMEVVGDPTAVPEIVAEFQDLIDRLADISTTIAPLERFAFYDAAKSGFAVIQTGETRLYGNIILKKGVIGGDSATD